MADHFSSIGFPVDTPEALSALAELAANAGEVHETSHGYYICWSPGQGVQLWVQANRGRELIGCHPHFDGAASLRSRIVQPLSTERAPLDGSVKGWANGAKSDSDMYPFLIDVPDYALQAAHLDCPTIVRLQIAAFARNVHCFASQEDYYSSDQRPDELAAKAFIPAGLFSPDGADVQPPEAYAIISGHVLECDLRNNPITNIPFWNLHIESLGGTFDVVADPATVIGEPAAGGLIFGHFWLSGRVAH